MIRSENSPGSFVSVSVRKQKWKQRLLSNTEHVTPKPLLELRLRQTYDKIHFLTGISRSEK